MRRYIITGAPGCGKTSAILALELAGTQVVHEAATDLITLRQAQGDRAPWEQPNCIDDIVKLQKHRQMTRGNDLCGLQFYDRSPICTYALALYLGFKPSYDLMAEIDRIHQCAIYEKQVFFFENLGFIVNTEARKISFEEALKFEQMHKEVYAKFGYEFVMVPATSIDKRLDIILGTV